MSEPQPPLLGYASSETHAERFARPFIGWTIVMAVMLMAAVAVDLASIRSGNSFFAETIRLTWFRPAPLVDMFGDVVLRLRIWVPLLVSPLIVTAVLITRRRDWEISPAAKRLILIAGLAMAVAAAMYALYLPLWILKMHRLVRQPDPVSQSFINAATGIISALTPPILVLAASSRRFHSRPDVARRIVTVLVIAWAATTCLMLADQLIRWAAGTTPYWARPAEGQWYAALTPKEREALDLNRRIQPLAGYAAAAISLVAALISIARPRARVAAFWTIAIAFATLPAVTLTLQALLYWAGPSIQTSWAGNLVYLAYSLLLAAAAQMSAVRPAQPPPLPKP